MSGFVTCDRYYLYTKDLDRSRGGTAGYRWAPGNTEYPVRVDTFRDGGEDTNTWAKVAEMEISPLHLVMIYVQYNFGTDPNVSGSRLDGKPILIPLNSGPDYLSTRPDGEYIMMSPHNGGIVGCVTAGVESLYGFTANDLPSPSIGAMRPYVDKTFSDNGQKSIVTTRTHATYTGEDNFRPTGRVENSSTNIFLSPRTLSTLQAPFGNSTVHNSRLSNIYTGGEIVSYYQTENFSSGSPSTQTKGLVRIGGVEVIPQSELTLVANSEISGTQRWLYRLASTLNVSIGTKLDQVSPGTIHYTPVHRFQGGVGIISTFAIGSYSDPWVSNQMPPPYTITSTNGHAVTGGYIAQV